MRNSNVRTNSSLICQLDTKGKIKLRKQRMDEFLVFKGTYYARIYSE